MTEVTEATTDQAILDVSRLEGLEGFDEVASLLGDRGHASIGNLWGSAQGLVLASIARREDVAGAMRMVVVSTEAEAEAFADDLEAFGVRTLRFPARERGARGASDDARSARARIQVVSEFTAGQAHGATVVASILSLLQPIPSARDLERQFMRLETGETLDVERLLDRLVKVGYSREPLAEKPGELSLRGDILDIFPMASDVPLRIELFEDEIESLRTFDPVDQRSIESMKSIEVCLASDSQDDEGASFVELLPAGSLVVEIEPLRVAEKAEGLSIQLPAHERALRTFQKGVTRHRHLSLQSLPGEDVSLDTRSVQGLEVGMKQAKVALLEATAEDTQVIVLCQNQAEEKRLMETLGRLSGVEYRIGQITRGFRIPAWRLVIVNHHELKGVLGTRRRAPARQTHKVKAIQSFFELKRGDLVVHAVHGLARYHGLKRMERGGGEEEHLHLVFADEVSLYVPSSRVDMVQRYIGPGGASLPLDKIGGTAFRRRKEKVERGLFDMAAELIEVQANRSLRGRSPWQGDAELVDEMIRSFPHVDTPDQSSTDGEIAVDLSSAKPMDRMICGDVGFGKTELAVRAAFRVVNGGGQVAILVPTTILAEQHFKTFKERLADFPVEVETISRYVTGKASRNVVERVAAGQVDILVGTHRMLSKDVQFKNLGLVIIDEEQRFGVKHKEHFKKLRAEVDVLTLTATPIPRTLHMSLSGIRDISALTVPPAGRQEIETSVGYSDDDELLQSTIRHELNRGGQVFFLHNRVSSIDGFAARLRDLVPEAVYAVGHGQMGSRELRAVMDSFTRGDADVLVATTIVENGLDIPLAGTILIDDADHFGLSELHQLRGRVGRGSQKAYCYLLVERFKPLKDIARERLKALEELNHLGAGFGISVKDLELRGAGNVLGAEQSGHIAAVGYDMYCRLLKVTVERIQSGEEVDRERARFEEVEAGVELELGLRAFLPEGWIPHHDRRLEVLRELAAVHSEEDADTLEASLKDRYGRMPDEARTLLRMFRLKARLDPHHLVRMGWLEDRYVVQYEDPVGFEQLFGDGRAEVRRIRRGVAHIVVPAGLEGDPGGALDWLENLLTGPAS